MPLRPVLRRAFVAAVALGLVALAQPALAAGAGEYEAQIIGGTVANDADFPGVVYIEVRQGSGGFACTGALIAPEWVLTAAHCISDGDEATIYGGDAEFRDAEWSETATGEQHPFYDDSGAAPRYDIGLYHLDAPHPTDLPDMAVADPGPFTTGTATAVGWGIDDSGETSDVLRRTTLGVQSASFCDDRAGAAFESDVMVCLFHTSHFTCSGDSGGPIIRNGEIIGVTSWGSAECDNISVAAGNDALEWVHEEAGLDDDQATGGVVDRIAGANRFETAAAIGTRFTGATTAYITSGRNFPDALAAAPAAAQNDAPVLLVEPTSLPDATSAWLREFQPTDVVVVGGTAAVSDAVVDQIRAASGATVRRIAGMNRYATAAATMLDAFPDGVERLFVASGRTFPDALIAGAAAGFEESAALLLVDGLGALEPEVLSAIQQLGPSSITLVGAAADFGTAVRTALGALATVDAVSGADVHARSAALWSGVPAGIDFAFLATSTQFADALAGAAYAARTSSPLMLIPGTCVPEAVGAQLDRLAPGAIVALGGNAAISDAVTSGLTTC